MRADEDGRSGPAPWFDRWGPLTTVPAVAMTSTTSPWARAWLGLRPSAVRTNASVTGASGEPASKRG